MASAQPAIIAQKLTSIAENTPNFADPTMYLAFTPLCPSEAADGAFIARASLGVIPPRSLVAANPARPPGTCNPYQLLSNVHLDADAIYYVDNQGPSGAFVLSRKLRTANAADPPTILWNFGSNLLSAELITYTSSLFLIVRRSGVNDELWQLDKLTGAIISLGVTSGAPFQLSNMQVDSRYLYWLNAGTLRRNDLTNGAQVTIATSVTSYYNEGYSEDCSPLGCTQLSRVLFGRLNRLENRYNLDSPFLLYTSPDANATLTGITRDGTKYYFMERRTVPGGGFDQDDRLFRLPVGNTTPDLIYGPINNGGPGFDSLRTDVTYLYFRNRQTRDLLRLPNDAAAIPVYALRATSIEITQGVQGTSNQVPLIQGRRTFVRLHARSDGTSGVNGVDAWLNVFDQNANTFLGTLRPKNRDGRIFVRMNPNRTSLDDSFYFELPLDWTRRERLTFTGVVNPTNVILENDYANNAIQTGAYTFAAGTRLPLHVVSFWYNWNGNLVQDPGLENWNSLRWIERVYPLPSTGGWIGAPGDGLRTESTVLVDDAIAARVNRTGADCDALLVAATATTPAIDKRDECAGNYAVGRIRTLRSAGDLPRGRYYYGSIAGQAGVTQFTRGFAPPNDTLAVGPSKDLDAEQNYMAHEIGHVLGRDHPASGGGGVCGSQDAADAAYPYPRARIGNSTTFAGDATAILGFDFGDNPATTPVVKGASTRGDLMSYCAPYWISDYTYVGILDWLTNVTPGGGGGGGGGGAGEPLVPGDWLIANGGLSLAEPKGAFTAVQRRDAVSDPSTPATGPWQLELRSVGGAVLASHPFTPEPNADEPTSATFSFVVPFVAGTRELRIVQIAGGAVAATKPISASPPSISNVALVGAPNPVTGTVTAAWTASDPDGGTLGFDVFLTRDDGASFEPIALSVPGTQVDLDTATWGGGTTWMRVVASDGAQTDVADSAPFEVADKAPIVRIASPAPDTAIQWGQLVNLVATIEDPQDAEIPDEDIVWSNLYRVLGTGRSLGVEDLEVGVNLVTVTVFNAAGLGAQASTTVLVGDDLALPGPRVSVLPATIGIAVAGNETEIQNLTLDVANSGGGVLAYLATSSTTWLTIDGTSSTTGTAPQTIAVAIDPSGLPDTAVSTAEILVYNALDLSEVISVPVSVAKGDLIGGKPFADADADGIDDAIDNCPLVANADQADADSDGVGDVCESACSNALDDDGDGLTDYPDDPACQTPTSTTENPKCDDDVDNDGDGKIDWDGGASGGTPDPQCIGKPWKNKEGASMCGLGAEVALLLPLLGWLYRRRTKA
jgi:hypothetical protein